MRAAEGSSSKGEDRRGTIQEGGVRVTLAKRETRVCSGSGEDRRDEQKTYGVVQLWKQGWIQASAGLGCSG
jgi:hypothetical protein